MPTKYNQRVADIMDRDPWWIFTCINLIYNIKKRYNMSLVLLVRTSPRFGVMLVSMALSIVFLIVDVLSTILKFGAVVGINPYWKVSSSLSSSQAYLIDSADLYNSSL